MDTRLDTKIILVVLACGAMLAWLSVARYESYNAGMFDLGIMAQSLWSGTQGDALYHTAPSIGLRSRMNVHVELFYFLIVPFYTLWPDPRLLLVVQAVLFAAGAIPLYRLALRYTSSVLAARSLTLIYLFYPTAQTSVLFDFHGDTLAMPLLLFVLDALDTRSWGWYSVFVALAVSCKFYVAVPIAGIGAYALLWGREGQHTAVDRLKHLTADVRLPLSNPQSALPGVLTILAMVAYGAVAFFVIRPLFAPDAVVGGGSSSSYLSHYFGNAGEILQTLPDRVLSAIVVFGPVLLVAWRGWRWLLPGLPIAFGMLVSTGPGSGYDFRYHHYALVVPFILMATVDGVARRQRSEQGKRRVGRTWRGDLVLTTGIVILFNILLVNTPLNPLAWKGVPEKELDLSVYVVSVRDRVKDQFLAEHVPPAVPLATSTFLAPHQANRETLYLVRYPDEPPESTRLEQRLPQVDYVLADALFDWYRPMDDGSFVGGIAYDRTPIGIVMRDANFKLIESRDGLVLFQRNPPPGDVLVQDVAVTSTGTLSPRWMFGDALGLVDATITPAKTPAPSAPQGERRFRVTFTWVAMQDMGPQQDYVAVSSLEGVSGARMVHLPTYALHPTTQWQAGDIVQETFEVDIPPDVAAGQYRWRVGWYNMQHPLSYATDARSRLAGSDEVVVGTVEVE